MVVHNLLWEQADDAIAVSTIFINTFLAGAGGVIAAAIVTRLNFGKTDVVQMLNGCIGGLVAITAEPLMPTPLAAILIGAVGGVIVVYGTKLLFSLKIDDVVGAVPAHLFAGIWGTLIVPATNADTSFSYAVNRSVSCKYICIYRRLYNLVNNEINCWSKIK
jgi:Amt family ammonium transporter